MATAEFTLLCELKEPYSRTVAQVQTARPEDGAKSLERAVRVGLFVLSEIRQTSKLWSSDVQGNAIPFRWEDSAAISQLFSWWLEESRKLLPLVTRYEASAGILEGAMDFREACQDVSLMSLDTEKAKQSIASLERGEGITLGQAMDELRNRLQ